MVGRERLQGASLRSRQFAPGELVERFSTSSFTKGARWPHLTFNQAVALDRAESNDSG